MFFLLPKIGGSQPRKVQWLLSQERVKQRSSNLAGTFTGSQRSSEQKSIQNFGPALAPDQFFPLFFVNNSVWPVYIKNPSQTFIDENL